MWLKIFNRCLFSSAILSAPQTIAIDTDIYTSTGSSSTTPPNILFIFDNSGNWNANYNGTDKRTIEHEALYRFFDDIRSKLSDADTTNDVSMNLAIMGTSHSGNGGKVIQHFTQVDSANTANIGVLQSNLYCDEDSYSGNPSSRVTKQLACEAQAGSVDFDTAEGVLASNQGLYGTEKFPSSNNSKYATTFWEAFQYFAGGAPVAGTNDGDHDLNAINGVSGQYISPIVVNGSDPSAEVCGKNYIVFIGNGRPSSGENSDAEVGLDSIGGSTSVVPISPSNYQSNWADEFARYFTNTDVNTNVPGDQNIRTFVIDVFDSSGSQTTPEEAGHALLESIAAQGGGSYFTAGDATEIVEKLSGILDEILAVNDVFAASSLPVSVNVRGTNLNQVYIGVFRPDANLKPRWFGNMKMYQLGFNTSTQKVILIDADGVSASSESTGFISESARSFWTHGSSFWAHAPDGDGGSSDNPDGELVEKGAAAQQIRDAGYAGRNLYTCVSCTNNLTLSSGVSQRFNNSNTSLTNAALGVSSAAERTTLIDWVRGKDSQDENSNGSTTDIRPSVHGDVLHSRPSVVNYGDTDEDESTAEEVYIFYGSNDGIFHAIKGGTQSSDGEEQWGFIIPEHVGQLKSLYDNASLATASDRNFFIDGAISHYTESIKNVSGSYKTNKAYIYLTMRRGGNYIYALDVSNPQEPILLWKKTKADSGFGELGQTWSAPVVSKIEGYTNPVLIMGMGYDPVADDAEPAGTATQGRGILVIDAVTGAHIWQAGPGPAPSAVPNYKTVSGMTYSIPSDITVIDRDKNGFADRLYVGDTGGNLWRADIFNTNRALWQVNKLLSVGARKFIAAPDVVANSDPSDIYDGVFIGTGDREHPFDTATQNYVLLYKDRDQGVVNSTATTIAITDMANATLSSALTSDPKRNKGWYIDLASGEKVVSKPAIVNGIAFFSSFQPASATSCSANLGTARSYQINYADATAAQDNNSDGNITDVDRSFEASGGGLLPDSVPVLVNINDILREAVVTGPQVQTAPGSAIGVRERVFWSKDLD